MKQKTKKQSSRSSFLSFPRVYVAVGRRFMLFYKIIATTSAVSSTNLGSILIFACCMLLYRSPVFSKFHKSKATLYAISKGLRIFLARGESEVRILVYCKRPLKICSHVRKQRPRVYLHSCVTSVTEESYHTAQPLCCSTNFLGQNDLEIVWDHFVQ